MATETVLFHLSDIHFGLEDNKALVARFVDDLARTRSLRALARWAAAMLPPGALVADGVALVVERLGDGDPDALAAEVMAEAPSRFGRNWESGPAH